MSVELPKRIGDGNPAKPPVLFYGSKPMVKDGTILEENKHWFSQFYDCMFKEDQTWYSCAEQYMMAEKARLFGDDEAEKKIMAAEKPRSMKAHGRKVRKFDQETWDLNKESIVFKANWLKFSQDRFAHDLLLKTKDRIIAEASPRDRVYGIGLGADHKDSGDYTKWRGQNLLGVALMKVRKALREREKKRKGGSHDGEQVVKKAKCVIIDLTKDE